MSKIPTAKEFLKNKWNYAVENNLTIPYDNKEEERLIEFAKLHVEAAIETCIEEAPSGSSTDTVSYEDVVKALKDCYPLTNIK